MTAPNQEKKCDAETTSLYIKVRERDGKKQRLTCVRVARYKINKKCYCENHAGLLCLGLMLDGVRTEVVKL